MLIKLLIIVSTGLITLSWTAVKMESYPMILQDRFVDDASRLNFTSSLPYYMMTGSANNNVTYPDGLSKGYAIQSLRTGLPKGAVTRVVADGFHSSLECQPADVNLLWARPYNPTYSTRPMNISVTPDGCSTKALMLRAPVWWCEDNDVCSRVFTRFGQIHCDEAAEDDETGKRVVVIFGNLTWTVDPSRNDSNITGLPSYFFELNQSAQLVCAPTYSLGKVDVVRNGTSTISVSPFGTWHTTLQSVSPWMMMEAQNLATSGNYEGDQHGYTGIQLDFSGTLVDVDPYMRLVLRSQDAVNQPATSLFDSTVLQNMITDSYTQFTAILAKQSLMEPASIEVLGSATVNANRLVVRTWAAQWMAGIVAAYILLSAAALFLVPRRGGILPCSPSTLSGTAVLVQNSHDLLARLRYAGAMDQKALAGVLQNATFQSGLVHSSASGRARFAILDIQSGREPRAPYFPQIHSLHTHPAIIHPATRVGLGLFLVGLIVALELLLRKSMGEDGLGDVGDDTYLHYTWTTIPAVVLGTLAIVFSAMDFRIRALAPYTAVNRTVSTRTLMELDFLDASIPRAIYKEIKLASFGALASTLALLIASLFTIVSVSLFRPVFIPITGSVTLRINDSFSARPSDQFDREGTMQSAGLILESNMSYPRFTYGSLAFPGLVSADIKMPDGFHYDPFTIPIHAVIPAIRPRLDCRSYDSSQMQLRLKMNDTAPPTDYYPNTLGIRIENEEGCIPDDDDHEYNVLLEMLSLDVRFFGRSTQASRNSSLDNPVRCSDHLYVWGELDTKSEPVVQHIAAMACNTTWEAVDVDTTFVGTRLDMDPENPPRSLEDTVRRTTANEAEEDDDDEYYAYALPYTNMEPDLLDDFFAPLTRSRWAVPRSSLGDPLHDEDTRSAIRFQSAIIQTQMLAGRRALASATNTTIADPQPGETDDQVVLRGNMTVAQGRHRVVQNPASTRVLEALLGAALALLLLGWFTMHQTAVLASSPASMASRLALVAGGNLVELLPENAEWRSGSEIEAALGPKTRFWMGWGTAPDSDGMNEAGESRFGIFGIREGDDLGEEKMEYQGSGGMQVKGRCP